METQDDLKVFTVEAKHEVHITYRVSAADHEDAIRRLCNIELFTEYEGYNGSTFGPCEFAMTDAGISVVNTTCFGDPGPTGRLSHQREWILTREDE